jgi:predicted DNA-binding transcriptional regulator AlpA
MKLNAIKCNVKHYFAMGLMELWNAKQTAKFLGMTYSQLWRIIGEGKNHPPYTLVGVRKRFIRSEVEKWLLDSQVHSESSSKTAGNPV